VYQNGASRFPKYKFAYKSDPSQQAASQKLPADGGPAAGAKPEAFKYFIYIYIYIYIYTERGRGRELYRRLVGKILLWDANMNFD